MFGARLRVYPKDAADSPWPTYLQHFRRSTVDRQIPANPNCSPPHNGGPDRSIRRNIPLLGDCRKTVGLNLTFSPSKLMFRDVTLSHQVSHPPRYVEDAHPTDLEGEGPFVSISIVSSRTRCEIFCMQNPTHALRYPWG